MALAARCFASAGVLFQVCSIAPALYGSVLADGSLPTLDESVLLQDFQSRSVSEALGIEETAALGIEETDAESASESEVQSEADSEVEADADLEAQALAMLCTLPLCRTAGPNAPLLYINEYSDGVGHRIRGIMSSIGLASQLHMNFGGILRNQAVAPHRVDTLKTYKRWFNFTNGTQLFVNKYNRTDGQGGGKYFFPELEEPPYFDRVFTDENYLSYERHVKNSIANGSHILLKAPRQDNRFEMGNIAQVRAELRRNLETVPRTEFNTAGVHVALHVRRGDLTREEAEKLNPDGYFYSVLKRIETALASDPVPIEMDVWSSTEPPDTVDRSGFGTLKSARKKKKKERPDLWTEGDFKGFTGRGIPVHLDTKDILSPLAHFAFADVLVLPGHSHFSMIAAFLSKGCIVAPWSTSHFKSHGFLDPSAPFFEQKLRACLSRARKDWSYIPAPVK